MALPLNFLRAVLIPMPHLYTISKNVCKLVSVHFQYNWEGEVIDTNDREYMWMDSYLCPSEDKDLFMTNAELKIDVPDSPVLFSWNNFLDSALPVLNVNYYQSLMMLAGSIACFHYPYSIQIAGRFWYITYFI